MAVAEEQQSKRTAEVLGKRMAFEETGNGDPILFLHGNPTSSYLWRNVIPHVQDRGRCLAPDLIGMGDSDKLDNAGPDRYRYVEHRQFLDAFLETIGVTSRVVLVGHDWGGVLAFDWARRHEDRVRGLVYMETIVRPRVWAERSEGKQRMLKALRSAEGEQMCLEDNFFVEHVLPGGVLRDLSLTEMEVYRRPYRERGESRRPTLTWPRELPYEGHPADVHNIVEACGHWLQRSDVPKLFINAEPGSSLTGANREFCRTWPNQVEQTVRGGHFLQEDSPHDIGEAIAQWLARID